MRFLALTVSLMAGFAQAQADSGFQGLATQLLAKCSAAPTEAYCKLRCGLTDAGLDLCAFVDPELANAAGLADSASIEVFGAEITAHLGVTPAVKKGLGGTVSSFPIFTAAGASELALNLIQGLALLIADRAQREAAAFVLGELRVSLCVEGVKDWFVSTCSLPGADQLQFYGSGAPAVQLLQRAITADILGWPTKAGGTASGALYAREVTEATDAGEPARHAMERAGEETVSRLVHGEWLFQAATPLVAEIDLQNRARIAAATPPAKSLQWAACAVSLPLAMATFRASSPQTSRYTEALAAMVASPSCWTLLGRGQFRMPAQGSSGQAATAPDETERLTTLIRLHRTLKPLVTSLATRTRLLEDATAAYAQVTSQAASVSPDGGDGLAAHQRELVLASIRVSRAGLQLSSLMIDNLPTVCRQAADPAWQFSPTCDPAAASTMRGEISNVVTFLDGQLGLAQAIADGDLQEAALRTLVLANQLCATSPCAAKFPSMDRAVSAALALASAKSSDQVAAVLDGLAAPIGSWRAKLESGHVTVSLTSHAGLTTAIEARWGQYGVSRYNGAIAWQAPTVSFPVGVELAIGLSVTSLAILVTVIDPFAFLQYDAAGDGRLPGARLLTVLAPGLSVRFPIFHSPFGVGLFTVYRPGFRSYESALNAPGADVLQVGLQLSVDVTLLVLYGSKD